MNLIERNRRIRRAASLRGGWPVQVNVHVARSNGRDEPPSVSERVSQVMGVVGLVATPVAMGVSYSRNHSVGWALLHGFVSIPYLVYVGIAGSKE